MLTIDTIFENAHVQTMDPAYPYASTIGIYDGKVFAIDDELEGVSARQHIDLAGHYMCPGFNDAHLHFSLLGAHLNQLDFRKQATPSLDRMYAKIKETCTKAGEGEWVIGWGFDQFSLGGFPDIAVLDEISEGHPVMIWHISHHAAVINTEAFRRTGFKHPDDIDKPGLVVKKDGKATGLVKEKMCFLIEGIANRVSEATMLHRLKLAADHTVSFGITSFSDAGTGLDSHWQGVGQSPYDIGLFQEAYEQSLVHQRGTLMPYFSALHELGQITGDVQNGYGLDLGIRTGLGNEMLGLGPFKIVLDGAFNSESAYLSKPYENDPSNYGVFSWDRHDFIEKVTRLHKLGWRMAMHAIGDEAVNAALDAIEHAQTVYPRQDVRHRIEHCGLADDSMVDRVIRNHVIPNPQGSFIKSNGDSYIRLLGFERARHVYRMGAFVHSGAIIPGSTDAPCAPVDPMISIEGMVTRKTADGVVLGDDECLNVDEALYAYTYGSAYASHKEQVLGSISRGKYADFAVLSQDPHDVEPVDLHEIDVEQTIIAGVVQYDRASL